MARQQDFAIRAGLSGKPWRCLHIDQQAGQLIFDKRALFLDDQHFIEGTGKFEQTRPINRPGHFERQMPDPDCCRIIYPEQDKCLMCFGRCLADRNKTEAPLPRGAFLHGHDMITRRVGRLPCRHRRQTQGLQTCFAHKRGIMPADMDRPGLGFGLFQQRPDGAEIKNDIGISGIDNDFQPDTTARIT